MQIIFTGEEMPESFTKSLFLCGPSLRPGQEKEMSSWRKDAIKILEDKGFDGIVFCPENRNFFFDNKDFNYDDQVSWEEKHLKLADCILFWMPRDLSLDSNGDIKLPAFTSNIEWGTWADSGKVVFGAPEDAEKVSYLKYYSDKFNVPAAQTLTETLDNALNYLGAGALRSGGERYVPLFVWKTPSFQSWYTGLKEAGNRLGYADLLYSFRPKYKSFVFLWILNVDVYIAAEDRHKTNEFVLARPDISSVLLYKRNEPINNSEVVIVKEFRSPANTKDGFIRELPAGSSAKQDEEPKEVAAHEVFEETGFHLDPAKLVSHNSRQLAGTLSSHKSNLYSMELNEEEMTWFKSQQDIVHGNLEDSERTFVEVYSVQSLIDNNIIDWSSLGMILSIIYSE